TTPTVGAGRSRSRPRTSWTPSNRHGVRWLHTGPRESGSLPAKEPRPMLSVLSQERREPGALPATLDFDEAALLNVTDPWHRSKLADDLAKQLTDLASTARRIRTEAVRELIGEHGVKQQQVA